MISKMLPGFKTTCYIVGVSFLLLPLSLFGKGLMLSMSEFQVPETITQSPHYYDAIFWVYLHMIVLGALIIAIGYGVENQQKQKWIALLLFLANIIYTYLDFIHADISIGNALYKGPGSVAPAFIGLLVTLLFLQITIRLFMKNESK